MKRYLLFTILLLVCSIAYSQKPRLIVTTDIGQDPDDEQSMIRLLHYASEFNIEGIIVNADANENHELPILKDYIVHTMINMYERIEQNLQQHDPEYPKADYLHSIVKKGCFGNSTYVPAIQYIGDQNDTEGSDWIIEVVDQADERPVNIAVWGGACDLAQALWKVRETRSPDSVNLFVQKLRVFFIGLQDSSNQWIIDNFPDMWLLLAINEKDKWLSSYRGMFWGGDMSSTSGEWLHKNIIGVNPLSSMYPDKAFTGGPSKNPNMAMKEGDSPSFMFFLDNGLNQPDHPEWGGWGGRYEPQNDHYFRDADDAVYDQRQRQVVNSPMASVYRWRPAFQNDFAARVQWGVKTFEEANHHPEVVINGHRGKGAVIVKGRPGQTFKFSALDSKDPDGHRLSYLWYFYPEILPLGSEPILSAPDQPEVLITIPELIPDRTIHLICEVTDQGNPALTSYKRILINIEK
jgi:hypothetical protein